MEDLIAKFTEASPQQYLAAVVALVWLAGINLKSQRKLGRKRTKPVFRLRGKRGTRAQRTGAALVVVAVLAAAGVVLNRTDLLTNGEDIFATLGLPGRDAQTPPAGEIPDAATLHLIERISDGDTVVLADGTKVRLYGIDTPEWDQPYGGQATKQLRRLLGNRVHLDIKDRDRYGRVVAVLYTPEGIDVNEAMVCAGAAWWYERHARREWHLDACQAVARRERLGLWQAPNPVPPWQWRRK